MLTKLRDRLTYANVLSTLALFVALGGVSYAGIALQDNSVRSRHIKNRQVKKADVARNAVNSGKVQNRTLRSQDFAPGQLPPGPRGLRGVQGPRGLRGTTGPAGSRIVMGNTQNITVPASDTRFLAPGGPSQVFGDIRFAEMITPEPIVARDLSVELGDPPGAGESYVITFLVNGTDTALACTVAGDTAKTCTDTTDAVSVPARAKIVLRVVTSAAATDRRVLYALRAVGP